MMSKNHDLEKAVEFMVKDNFEVEDGLERIIWLRHGAGDKIRLLEVNRNGIPVGRVEAFYFAPFEQVPFEIYLADITPDEWQKILRGEIPMPEGWSLKNRKEYVRSDFDGLEEVDLTADRLGSNGKNFSNTNSSAERQDIAQNKKIENAAARLAQRNFEAEDGLELVIWLRHGVKNKIRLIEVNRNGFPMGRIEAFYFSPTKEVPFKTYLADITPEEWQKVLKNEIPLPQGWSLENSKKYLRSDFKELESVG